MKIKIAQNAFVSCECGSEEFEDERHGPAEDEMTYTCSKCGQGLIWDGCTARMFTIDDEVI